MLWRQMQADMFNRDIVTINSSEGPALGVALLAGVGAGIYDNVPQACEATIKRESIQRPIPENVEVYDKYYPIYKGLYADLKDKFKEISMI